MAAVPTNLTGSDQVVATTYQKVAGWSIRNSHATNAVTIDIYNHASAASGKQIASINLAAGGYSHAWFGPQGILADLGVYVDIGGTGTAFGSVFLL